MKINCPTCQKQLTVPDGYEFRPFCSARCKQVDLLNWLEGRYFLPRDVTPEDIDHLPAEQKEAIFAELLKKATSTDG